MATEITVQECQNRIAAYLDQSPNSPTPGGSDWNLRLKFMNRRQDQWARTYDWDALRHDFSPTVTGVGQSSVALPVDFNRIGSEVVLYGTATKGLAYPVINREDIRNYSITDQYVTFGGNRNQGFFLNFNPATLASGASLILSYYSIATSLASPANVSPIPDPDYLVTGTIADILESRSDERFPIVKQDAERSLQQMLENENTPQVNQENSTMTVERKMAFRLGRN